MTRVLRLLIAALMLVAVVLTSSGTAVAQDEEVQWVEVGTGHKLNRIVNGHHVVYTCSGGRSGPYDQFDSDEDWDNDGVVDAEDGYPFDENEHSDSDSDCFGDSVDAFPLDPLVWGDQDGDGIADFYDDDDGLADGSPGPYAHCTLGYTIRPAPLWSFTDADGDRVGDVDDAFPWNADSATDEDGDCEADYPSEEDPAFTEQSRDLSYCSEGYVPTFERFDAGPGDSDEDGLPDVADGFPQQFVTDMDDDCVTAAEDEFPLDPTEWADFDRDGIGDNADPDDDNDGVLDEDDPFLLNASERQDGDGIDDGALDNDLGNDLDDDNDGALDDDLDGVLDDEDGSSTEPSDPEQTTTAEAVFEELKTGDPELDAMLQELLDGGNPYSSSSYTTSGYGNNSLYQFDGGYPSSGNSSSGSGLRAIRWLILLPLVLIRWAVRSDGKRATR